jgi:septal ring-binding cell division protein DamX
MVLSKYKSVLAFLNKNKNKNKNKNLNDNIRFFQTSKKGEKKYIVIYGSFKTTAIASNKMKSLPAKYRKSWVRRFGTLQKIINH